MLIYHVLRIRQPPVQQAIGKRREIRDFHHRSWTPHRSCLLRHTHREFSLLALVYWPSLHQGGFFSYTLKDLLPQITKFIFANGEIKAS